MGWFSLKTDAGDLTYFPKHQRLGSEVAQVLHNMYAMMEQSTAEVSAILHIRSSFAPFIGYCLRRRRTRARGARLPPLLRHGTRFCLERQLALFGC